MRLQLYYPIKSYFVNQSWGVYNDIYNQFGFTRHNGIDCKLSEDKLIYSPVKMKIVQVGYQSKGAGNFVSAITLDEFDEWRSPTTTFYKVYLTFMHLKDTSVKEGEIVNVGDIIGHGDNTGFSTGEHLHLFCGRVKEVNGQYIFTDEALKDANYSFDHSFYWTGQYAIDYKNEQLRLEEERKIEETKKIENLKYQVENLKEQVTIYQKVIELFIRLKNLF